MIADPRTMQENTFKLTEGIIEVQAETIRNLKEEVADLTTMLTVTKEQRGRLLEYVLCQEDYDATVGEFPEADLPLLSRILTLRAQALREARQVLIDHGDIGYRDAGT